MNAEVVEPYPSGPSADGTDEPYWTGLRDGNLSLPRCAHCATWRPPGGPLCPECHSFDTSWEVVAAKGSVFTWIRTHRDFMSELDLAAPYVTVLVELDDAPIKVLGLLSAADAQPSIGTRVSGDIVIPANATWPVMRWNPTQGADS